MRPLAVILLAMTAVGSGACATEIQHDLEEAQANQIVVALGQQGIRARKQRDEGRRGSAVWVIGVPDLYRGESPRAYVTLADDAAADELKDWLNRRVGKHERVDQVVIRETLPKTMIGKLDRKALRDELGL